MRGLSGGKLWLAIGALAATAGASFWLGRLSTPAHDAASLEASAAVSTAALSTSAPPSDLALARTPSVPETLATAEGAAPEGAVPRPPDAASDERRALVPTSAAVPIDGAFTAERLPSRQHGAPRARRALGLAAEIEQLARAEAALRQGRAAHALLVLEQRSVQHLLEQAAALRAIAECELGSAGADGRARDMLELWPASAFQPRIANACAL